MKGAKIGTKCGISLTLWFTVGMLGMIGVKAQVADDFSSGTFITNNWIGDTIDFRFTSSSAIPPAQQPAIQLFVSGAGSSLIYVRDTAVWPMIQWDAWYKLSFNPTASNFARFYLTAGSNFPHDMEGSIFVGVGMENKRVGLYIHDTNDVNTLLIDTLHYFNQTLNHIRLKIIFKNDIWYLYVDPIGEDNYILTDSVLYPTNINSIIAGLYCQYTTSNSTKFYFDDIYCGPLIIDTIPPVLEKSILRNSNQISLHFSEPLHPDILNSEKKFSACQNIGNPILIYNEVDDPSIIHLLFKDSFPEGIDFTLSLKDISDRSGNKMLDTTILFRWYSSKRNDVVINEIMANSRPAVKLPEAEYIELYNSSNNNISLCDWALLIDDAAIELPCISFMPDSYIILINDRDTLLWEGFNNIVPLSGMSLRNSGACLAIRDHKQRYIHSVCYTENWHNTTFQANGGYSLELKDYKNACSELNTWGTTLDISGGTPGKRNSYSKTLPDNRAPKVMKVYIENIDIIGLIFSEPIDTSKPLCQIFKIEEDNIEILNVKLVHPRYEQALLKLSQQLQEDSLYHIILIDTLKDCSGNYTLQQRLPFGLPTLPDSLDIIFNEIMFNSDDHGAEYIELLNISNKIIDLSHLLLARVDTLNMAITDMRKVSDMQTLVFPSDYCVITKDVHKLLSKHPYAIPELVHENSSMPLLPNSGATYALISQNGKIIDMVTYDQSYHSPVLRNTKGVSLERLSAEMPTNSKKNWYSASPVSFYATPTLPNSQQLIVNTNNASVSIEPDHFYPYGHSGSNITSISLNDIESGTLVSIIIHDETGKAVRHLAQETYTGNSGIYIWDGTNDHGNICNGGVYIISVKMYEKSTGTKHIKIPVILVSG